MNEFDYKWQDEMEFERDNGIEQEEEYFDPYDDIGMSRSDFF